MIPVASAGQGTQHRNILDESSFESADKVKYDRDGREQYRQTCAAVPTVLPDTDFGHQE